MVFGGEKAGPRLLEPTARRREANPARPFAGRKKEPLRKDPRAVSKDRHDPSAGRFGSAPRDDRSVFLPPAQDLPVFTALLAEQDLGRKVGRGSGAHSRGLLRGTGRVLSLRFEGLNNGGVRGGVDSFLPGTGCFEFTGPRCLSAISRGASLRLRSFFSALFSFDFFHPSLRAPL